MLPFLQLLPWCGVAGFKDLKQSENNLLTPSYFRAPSYQKQCVCSKNQRPLGQAFLTKILKIN